MPNTNSIRNDNMIHKNLQSQHQNEKETETRQNKEDVNETRLCHDVGATPHKKSSWVFRNLCVIIYYII